MEETKDIPDYLKLWGKADNENGNLTWHPLAYHMLDVAAVAEEVLNREPERTRQLYAEDYGLQWEEAKGWILFFVAMHDIGKATPAFQYKIKELLANLKPINLTLSNRTLIKWEKEKPTSHGELSVKIISEVLKNIGYEIESAKFISEAVGIHHGYRTSRTNLRKINLEEEGNENWKLVRNTTILSLLSIYCKNKNAIPRMNYLSSSGFMRLAGLTAFSDWIGSNTEYFKFVSKYEEYNTLNDYLFEARKKSIKALDAIGWHQRVSLLTQSSSLEDIFFYLSKPNPFKPRPLQIKIKEIVDTSKNPILIMIEAPMGEGKTEASIYAHLKLQYNIQHRGMYIALPTQATGNSMFKRISEFLKEMKHPVTLDLQLLHGAAFLNDSFVKLKMKAIYSKSNSSITSNIVAEEWFTHKKRSLLSDYGVGTIDQALLSVMNTKHQFVRIWGLGNRVVILDEVHAYDMYTSTLIESLIEWLYALGSSVILMSATLPKSKRDSLMEAFGSKENNYSEYPRITYLEQGEEKSHSVEIPKNPERKIKIKLESISTEIEKLSNQLQQLVSDGGCAVCIVNTVQRAQDIYKLLKNKKSDIELFLFHARFPAEDRKSLEDKILSKFGKKNPEQRPKKAILVATQVVEQSLDLDFDVMVTDLAPIDLILQRAGRLHRHIQENRFSHSTPTLYISGLDLEIESIDFGKPLYWDIVYEKYILLKTWWNLNHKSCIDLPDEIDRLVEAVYEENNIKNAPESFSNTLQASKDEMEKVKEEDKINAIYSVIGSPLDSSWKNPNQIKQEDEDDLATHPVFIAKTRKGDRNVTVIPIFESNKKLFLDHNLHMEISFSTKLSFEQAKIIFLRSVNLSRKDVVNYLTSVSVPKNWKENSLLRSCHPLILKENQFNIGKLSISYNEELGIVYTNME